jgi:hypothetical protein
MVSEISSAVLVQVNGLGFLFQALVHYRMAAKPVGMGGPE